MQHDSTKKFVCLEGIIQGNKFYTSNSEKDPRFSAKGELWYKIIGYADSSEEAVKILYPTKEEENRAIAQSVFDLIVKYRINEI